MRRATLVLASAALTVSGFGLASVGSVEAATPRCQGAQTMRISVGWADVPSKSRRDASRLCILAYGDRNAGVLTLQKTLNRCYDAGLKEDGIYGQRTRAAVRRAQSLSGARTDGIYGPETASRIDHFARDTKRCGRL